MMALEQVPLTRSGRYEEVTIQIKKNVQIMEVVFMVE